VGAIYLVFCRVRELDNVPLGTRKNHHSLLNYVRTITVIMAYEHYACLCGMSLCYTLGILGEGPTAARERPTAASIIERRLRRILLSLAPAAHLTTSLITSMTLPRTSGSALPASTATEPTAVMMEKAALFTCWHQIP
jgi:hypothetical protein